MRYADACYTYLISNDWIAGWLSRHGLEGTEKQAQHLQKLQWDLNRGEILIDIPDDILPIIPDEIKESFVRRHQGKLVATKKCPRCAEEGRDVDVEFYIYPDEWDCETGDVVGYFILPEAVCKECCSDLTLYDYDGEPFVWDE